jgi:hypothetical protein
MDHARSGTCSMSVGLSVVQVPQLLVDAGPLLALFGDKGQCFYLPFENSLLVVQDGQDSNIAPDHTLAGLGTNSVASHSQVLAKPALLVGAWSFDGLSSLGYLLCLWCVSLSKIYFLRGKTPMGATRHHK